jgi:hypothetical protein
VRTTAREVTSMVTSSMSARKRAEIGARSLRTDRWWAYPVVFAAFIIVVGGYLTVRIFIPRWY